MKFLKTIRFDPSDARVFEQAASPDEWAIPGGFVFSGLREEDLTGKIGQAFGSGFLSLDSFGRSTFASVAEISPDETEALTAVLADHFVAQYGAPSVEEALDAAREEIGFTLGLCRDTPINSVFAMRRFFGDDGEIREEFRLVEPPGEKRHTRIWDIVEE